jgi:alkanesulfonate monooxygenase SsuD/methylene tetrahydromethanopterin reductase-like flavin-dependent oxidoreductase (luciferase family)
MKVDRQLHNGRAEWPALRDLARRAEDEGADTVWVFDHLDGETLGGDRPMIECFTLLGALAAATTTIGLGSMVVNVANRHPAIATLAAMSVQRISGGRMTLGIGAGSAPGSRFAAEQLRRGIDVSDAVEVRYAAVADQIRWVREADPKLPVIVGVSSDRLAVLAGELADGINVRLAHPRAGELLDLASTAAGQRPFERSAYALPGDAAAAPQRAEDLGLDRLVLLDPPD